MRRLEEHELQTVSGGRRLAGFDSSPIKTLNTAGVAATLAQRVSGFRDEAPDSGNKGYCPYDKRLFTRAA